jgi:hypothetical protein
LSSERCEERRDFIANISDLTHLPEEVALLREHIYTKVEDRYSIRHDQVTVWFFLNGKEGEGVIFEARNDEGAEPGQILLPEYVSEG